MFAGRLVDALAQGTSALNIAVEAFAAMAALGLAMVLLRHFAWAGVVPLTLGMMRDIAQGAFHRVQRFSTDWHNNSFAGSTVRKITRGMWALDSLNDVLLLALLPSVVVLVGTVRAAGASLADHGRGHGLRRRRLRGTGRDARHARHRAGVASVQCDGYAHRRRAFRCAGRERRGQIVRRGGPRGCAPERRHRQMESPHAAHLDAPHLERHGAARAALGRAHGGHRRRHSGSGGKGAPRPARSLTCSPRTSWCMAICATSASTCIICSAR